MVLEEGDRESALELPFACERLNRLDAQRYELSSSDGTEKVVFALSDDGRVLRPVSWHNHEKKRFLFKKFEIEAVAEYRDFAWR